MLKLLSLQKFGVVCGFILPLVAFGCIGVAIVSYPEFSWTNNALSDLGAVSGVTAFAFNFGLFTAGVLGFFFAVLGLFSYFKNAAVGKIGVAVFAVATVWLMGIGVFNESFYPVHFVVAVLFFVTMPVAFWVLAVALYLRCEVDLAVFTLFSSVVAAVPWAIYLVVRYVPNVAVPEAVSAVISLIWIIIMSYKMLKTVKPQ